MAANPKILGLGSMLERPPILRPWLSGSNASGLKSTLFGARDLLPQPCGTDVHHVPVKEVSFYQIGRFCKTNGPFSKLSLESMRCANNGPALQLYSKEDLAHRVLYVEASHDCPFR